MDIRTPLATNGGDWIPKFRDSWEKQIEALRAAFKEAVEEVRVPWSSPTDVPIVYARKDSLVPILKFLKEEPGCEYDFLSDITATDEEVDPRFEVVYNLYSLTHHARIRVKVRVPEGEAVPTAIPVWKGANWAEREVFDMFGVRFEGHPDLRRILMDERFEGYPLRKDYPLRGYQIFTEPQAVQPGLLEE